MGVYDMKLRDLVKNLEILECTAPLDTEISGVSYDSRVTRPGDLFVAIKGFEADGHKFIPKAVERGAAAVLYVVCALAQSPLLGVLACGLTGLCVSLLWPGAIILASRRIPSAGAAMFALLSAGGDVGASLGAFCVGRAADWAQASGTVFAGAAGESGALRAGLLLAAVFPLLCCGVHTALHCSEARAGLPAGSERRRRQ